MLFFGIIALILILKPEWIWKYTGRSDRFWRIHGYDLETSKIVLWITRIIGVIFFVMGLYYEFG